MDQMSLAKLQPGESACVHALTATGGMRRRLEDLGISEGSIIDCIERSPLGDPTAYRICGAVVALRVEDAGTILVEKVGGHDE